MANILYGVNGEGSGHSTRAKEILRHLVRQGHNVHILSFDRGLRNLSTEFDVTEIHGLRFAFVQNRVRYGRTVMKNLLAAPRAAKCLANLSRLVDEWSIDLVCTDFEPMSCQVGLRKRLPVLSIDNQHCLTHARVSMPPDHKKEMAAAKIVTRLMIPRADAYLITSFFTAPSRHRGAYVFPPILRSEVLSAATSDHGHVLVYVTTPSSSLANLLSSVNCQFVCYGFDREGTEGNVTFRKPSQDGFLRDLTSCTAVIGNSGSSLVGEALYLRKPYLAWPVKKQFEQVLNAFQVERMGFGKYWDDLNQERIEAFLFNLPEYRSNLASHPQHDNSALFQKLNELIAVLASRKTSAARGMA